MSAAAANSIAPTKQFNRNQRSYQGPAVVDSHSGSGSIGATKKTQQRQTPAASKQDQAPSTAAVQAVVNSPAPIQTPVSSPSQAATPEGTKLPPMLLIRPQFNTYLVVPKSLDSVQTQTTAVEQYSKSSQRLAPEQRVFIANTAALPLMAYPDDFQKINAQQVKRSALNAETPPPSALSQVQLTNDAIIKVNTPVIDFNNDVHYREYRKMSKTNGKPAPQPPLSSPPQHLKMEFPNHHIIPISGDDVLEVTLPPINEPQTESKGSKGQNIFYRGRYVYNVCISSVLAQIYAHADLGLGIGLHKAFLQQLVFDGNIKANVVNVETVRCLSVISPLNFLPLAIPVPTPLPSVSAPQSTTQSATEAVTSPHNTAQVKKIQPVDKPAASPVPSQVVAAVPAIPAEAPTQPQQQIKKQEQVKDVPNAAKPSPKQNTPKATPPVKETSPPTPAVAAALVEPETAPKPVIASAWGSTTTNNIDWSAPVHKPTPVPVPTPSQTQQKLPNPKNDQRKQRNGKNGANQEQGTVEGESPAQVVEKNAPRTKNPRDIIITDSEPSKTASANNITGKKQSPGTVQAQNEPVQNPEQTSQEPQLRHTKGRRGKQEQSPSSQPSSPESCTDVKETEQKRGGKRGTNAPVKTPPPTIAVECPPGDEPLVIPAPGFGQEEEKPRRGRNGRKMGQNGPKKGEQKELEMPEEKSPESPQDDCKTSSDIDETDPNDPLSILYNSFAPKKQDEAPPAPPPFTIDINLSNVLQLLPTVTPDQFIQLSAKQRKTINKNLRQAQNLKNVANPKTLQMLFPTIGGLLDDTPFIYPNGEIAPDLRLQDPHTQSQSQSPGLRSISPKVGAISPLSGPDSPSLLSLSGQPSAFDLGPSVNSANVILHREPGEAWSVDQNQKIYIDPKKLSSVEDLRADFTLALAPPQRNELVRCDRKWSSNSASGTDQDGLIIEEAPEELFLSVDEVNALYEQTLKNTIANVDASSNLPENTTIPAVDNDLSNSFYLNRTPEQRTQDQECIAKLTAATNTSATHLAQLFPFPAQPLFRACTMCQLEFKFTCNHCPFLDVFDMDRFDLKLCRKYKESGTYPLQFIYHSALNLPQLTLSPSTISANDVYHQYGVGTTPIQFNKAHNKRSGARKHRPTVTDAFANISKNLPPHTPKALRFAEHVVVRTIPSRDMERKAFQAANRDSKDNADKHEHKDQYSMLFPPLESYDDSTDEIVACSDHFDPDWNPAPTFAMVHGRIVDFANPNDKLPLDTMVPKSIEAIKTLSLVSNKLGNIHTDKDFIELSSQRTFAAQTSIFASKVLKNYQKLYSFDVDVEQRKALEQSKNQDFANPTSLRLKSAISKPRPPPQVIKVKASKGIPAYSFIQYKHELVATFEFKSMKKGPGDHQMVFSADTIDGVIIANGNKIPVSWGTEFEINPERCGFSSNLNKATFTLTLGLINKSQKWTNPFSLTD